jgi:hypothetical protein
VTLIIKIIAVALLHLAFYASYPETGPFGNYYLAISLLVWSVFIIFVNTSAKLVRLVSGLLGLAVNLAAFGLMGLALAATMPQRDRTSVLEKLQARRFPDADTVRSGMLRFGIKLDTRVKADIKGLDSEIDKAITRLKED